MLMSFKRIKIYIYFLYYWCYWKR